MFCSALPWEGVLANEKQNKIPMQPMMVGQSYVPYIPQQYIFQQQSCTEDCLYLNIFVPETQSKTRLPVRALQIHNYLCIYTIYIYLSDWCLLVIVLSMIYTAKKGYTIFTNNNQDQHNLTILGFIVD